MTLPIHCAASEANEPSEEHTDSPSVSETSEKDDPVEAYEKQADEIIDEIWTIFRDESGWSDESQSKDGQDVVVSKSYPKWGKVFRLTVSGPAEATVDREVRSV